jgi:flagellar hook assembly protein FlgD
LCHRQKYYCRIKYKDNAGNVSGTSSVSDGVLVDTVPPSVPILQNPVDTAWSYDNPAMFWSSVQDTESGINSYILQISTNNVFNTMVFSSDTKNFFVTGLDLPAGRRYYWRVIARDVAGNSAYTPAWSFTRSGTTAKLSLTVPGFESNPLVSDGVDVATVTITVLDTNNNRIEDAVNIVSFTVTDNGKLSSANVICTSGIALIFLTSTRSSEPITITAVSDGLTAGNVTVTTKSDGIPYLIELKSQKNSIVADNSDITEITAVVRDMYGNRVFNMAVPVKFGINEYGVIIGSNEIVTDPIIGKAVVPIKSSTTVADIVIYGYSAGLTTGCLTVQSVPGPADHVYIYQQQPGAMLPADGITVSTIIAQVVDNNNNSIKISSVAIELAVTGDSAGWYNKPAGLSYVYTDTDGKIVLNIKTTTKTGIVRITATTAGLNTGVLEFGTVACNPSKILLTTIKNNITANNIDSTKVVACIVDANNNVVVTSTDTVVFNVYSGSELRVNKTSHTTVVNGTAEYAYSDNIAGKMTVVCVAVNNSINPGNICITGFIDGSTGGDYLFDDGTKITFPAWCIEQNTKFKVEIDTSVTVQTTGGDISLYPGTIRQFRMYSESGIGLASKFNRDIIVIIPYNNMPESEIDKLRLFEVNTGAIYPAGKKHVYDSSGDCIWVRDVTIDKPNKRLIAKVKSLTTFALGTFTMTDNLLYQNYPNPFNPRHDLHTRIEYSVVNELSTVHVTVRIYNIACDLIRTLTDSDVIPGTKQYVDWNGKNEYNEYVSDGIYLCQLITPKYKKTIKIIFVK